MIVRIDAASPVPPFEQLRSAIADLVEQGRLAIGARLPTVRQLSADLGVAPGTVARAFRELEADGVVTTKGRHGTFVAGPVRRSARERRRRLDDAVHSVVTAAVVAGVGADELLEMVRAAAEAAKGS